MRFGHVAIDGPVASGKTTVARIVAGRLGVLYLDTGAMYRAFALLAIRAGVGAADETALLALAESRPIHVILDPKAEMGFRLFAGGEELGSELYGNEVSSVASIVAAHPRIRSYLVARQRAIASEGSVVMAGRDIGTVVLPEASLKIFLTASVDSRVERRRAELAQRGITVDAATLRSEIVERDRQDRERTAAPLRPAQDAIEIDSSELTIDQVVERIASLARDGARS